MGWELEEVEKPFVAQLQGPGGSHVEGNLGDPAIVGRVRVMSPLEGISPFVQGAAAQIVRQPVGHLGV